MSATLPRWRSVVTLRLRRPPVSFRLRPRVLLAGAGLAVATCVAIVTSVSVGTYPVPLGDVLAAILGIGEPTGGSYIVTGLRMPRTITGVCVGAALGLSGAIFQGMARNPLASPDVLGVTQGAALAAVAVMVLGTAGPLGLSLSALAGGFVATGLVYLLAWRHGVSTGKLVLVGMGISMGCMSLTSMLLVRADIREAQEAAVWLTGSLNGRGWEHAAPVGLTVLVLIPFILVLGRQLLLQQLGDELARGVGLRLQTSRVVLVALAVALAATATAVAGPIGSSATAGPIGFVALIAPQIARRFTGGPGLPLVPSAFAGAVLVVGADIIARRAFAPIELPVGVITGALGAPYFLWLLARRGGTGGTL